MKVNDKERFEWLEERWMSDPLARWYNQIVDYEEQESKWRRDGYPMLYNSTKENSIGVTRRNKLLNMDHGMNKLYSSKHKQKHFTIDDVDDEKNKNYINYTRDCDRSCGMISLMPGLEVNGNEYSSIEESGIGKIKLIPTTWNGTEFDAEHGLYVMNKIWYERLVLLVKRLKHTNRDTIGLIMIFALDLYRLQHVNDLYYHPFGIVHTISGDVLKFISDTLTNTWMNQNIKNKFTLIRDTKDYRPQLPLICLKKEFAVWWDCKYGLSEERSGAAMMIGAFFTLRLNVSDTNMIQWAFESGTNLWNLDDAQINANYDCRLEVSKFNPQICCFPAVCHQLEPSLPYYPNASLSRGPVENNYPRISKSDNRFKITTRFNNDICEGWICADCKPTDEPQRCKLKGKESKVMDLYYDTLYTIPVTESEYANSVSIRDLNSDVRDLIDSKTRWPIYMQVQRVPAPNPGRYPWVEDTTVDRDPCIFNQYIRSNYLLSVNMSSQYKNMLLCGYCGQIHLTTQCLKQNRGNSDCVRIVKYQNDKEKRGNSNGIGKVKYENDKEKRGNSNGIRIIKFENDKEEKLLWKLMKYYCREVRKMRKDTNTDFSSANEIENKSD